jgi:hypothetical protein
MAIAIVGISFKADEKNSTLKVTNSIELSKSEVALKKSNLFVKILLQTKHYNYFQSIFDK